MKILGIKEFQAGLTQLLAQIRQEGGGVEVSYHGKPFARLVDLEASPLDESLELVHPQAREVAGWEYRFLGTWYFVAVDQVTWQGLRVGRMPPPGEGQEWIRRADG